MALRRETQIYRGRDSAASPIPSTAANSLRNTVRLPHRHARPAVGQGGMVLSENLGGAALTLHSFETELANG